MSPKIYAAIDPVRKIWNELGLLFDDPQVKEVLTLVLLSVASVSGYLFIHFFLSPPPGPLHSSPPLIATATNNNNNKQQKKTTQLAEETLGLVAVQRIQV